MEWTGTNKARLKELCIAGFKEREIAKILSKELGETVTTASVNTAKSRHGLAKYLLEKDTDIEQYRPIEIPMEDYMICCDLHAPFHSEVWFNRMLAVADRFKMRKLIVAGDLVDFDFAKHWYSDFKIGIDAERRHVEPVIAGMDYFDVVYQLQGNHEHRPNRITEGRIHGIHMMELFGGDVWKKKFIYSIYDRMLIGDSWIVMHPKTYGRNSPRVAVRMTTKYHRHNINTHGHLCGMSFDISGKFLGIDLGNMIDTNKIEYINKHTTDHPVWKNGFGMLKDGHFYHFTDATDWSFCLCKTPSPLHLKTTSPFQYSPASEWGFPC